jgi:hypothetical protein
VLVLARVVTRLGSLELVTAHEIEGLFAVDLAYLQDFYGVVNFGSAADVQAMLDAQREAELTERREAQQLASASAAGNASEAEVPNGGDEVWPQPEPRGGRRAAIEEVRTGTR